MYTKLICYGSRLAQIAQLDKFPQNFSRVLDEFLNRANSSIRSFNLLTSDGLELGRSHRLQIIGLKAQRLQDTYIIDLVHVEDGLGGVADHEDEDNAGEEGGHGGVAAVGVAARHGHHVPEMMTI